MIYETPFDPATKLCTGPSEPAAFESIDDIVAMLGEPIRVSRYWAIYDGLCFGPVVMQVEPRTAE